MLSGAPLPRKACVTLEDLQSFHKSSRATPRAVVGEPKRLPIIAVSRDLAAGDADDEEFAQIAVKDQFRRGAGGGSIGLTVESALSNAALSVV